MGEEAQNSRKGSIVVQTGASQLRNLGQMRHLPVSPSASLHSKSVSKPKSDQGLVQRRAHTLASVRRTTAEGHNRALCTAAPVQSPPTPRGYLGINALIEWDNSVSVGT